MSLSRRYAIPLANAFPVNLVTSVPAVQPAGHVVLFLLSLEASLFFDARISNRMKTVKRKENGSKKTFSARTTHFPMFAAHAQWTKKAQLRVQLLLCFSIARRSFRNPKKEEHCQYWMFNSKKCRVERSKLRHLWNSHISQNIRTYQRVATLYSTPLAWWTVRWPQTPRQRTRFGAFHWSTVRRPKRNKRPG